jgi:hypothetical protein
MQHRNFQLFIAGQLISLIGTWMQNMAQLWLVYQLTHSAVLLGVFGFASQVPMLFLSSLGGYVGDRYNRHRGVIVTQSVSMILAFVLAGLTLTKLINEWELIVIEGDRPDTGIPDEFGGSGSDDRRAPFCGAKTLPGAGAMGRYYLNDLRGVPYPFFTGEDILAVHCGAVRCGICGHVADGGHEHLDSKSRSG